MEVKMSSKEKACGEYCDRWNRRASWDYYCIAKDCYLNGYYQAKANMLAALKAHGIDTTVYEAVGDETVDVEIISQQTGVGRS